MTLSTRDNTDHHRSVGIEATPLERYSAVELDGGELIVYNQEINDAWIQSDLWVEAQTNS